MGSLPKNQEVKENSLLLCIPKEKILQFAEEDPKFDKNYDYFHVMNHLEPHTIRRKAILEKYPQIEKLFKKDPYPTIIPVFIINIIQLVMCFIITKYNYDWYYLAAIIFCFGAVLNHSLFVLYHDITHFNCFKSVKVNQIFAIIANLPQIIPSAIGFGRYHRDHHTSLGDVLNDPDIPTVWEIHFFKKWYLRLGYFILMPLFYGLRPYFKAPKPPILMEYINLIACFTYAYLIYFFFSGKALAYLFLSTWVGFSIHPVTAHVIAEHYEFIKGQDTYSYYGWINLINFNMGYHIEHHDFPNISWHRLPEVRKIAPEFYDNLPKINSYLTVFYKYIFDGSIGPWSRIILDSYYNRKTE